MTRRRAPGGPGVNEQRLEPALPPSQPLLAGPGGALRLVLGSRKATRLLVLFFSIDLALIALHLLTAAARHAGLIDSDASAWPQLFSIVNDRGLPESFNQLKALLAAAVLCTIWTRTRQPVYLCWAFIFAVAFLDDALRIHEQAGAALAGILLTGIAAEHREFIGQLLVAGIYVILFGAMLLLAHASAEPRHARTSSLVLIVFAIVVFFAVVVDALHGVLLAVRPALAGSTVFQALFNVLEEGGEMLSLSLALAVVIAIRAAAEATAPAAMGGARRSVHEP